MVDENIDCKRLGSATIIKDAEFSPIESEEFYGTSSGERLEFTMTKAIIASKKNLKLENVFPRQVLAFEFLATKSEDFHIFSEEIKITSENDSQSTRRYIVETYDVFWRVYILLEKKYFYELIPENSPAKLYLDVEFKTEGLIDEDFDALMGTLYEMLLSELNAQFHLDMRTEDILDLDATTSEKFSHHLIFPKCVFVNNIQMGYYIVHLVNKLRERVEGDSESRARSFFREKGGKLQCIIDTGVYSRNRTFRLFLSSKLNKNNPLKRSSTSQFPFSDLRQLFLDSLVCNVGKGGPEYLSYVCPLAVGGSGWCWVASGGNVKATSGSGGGSSERSPFPQIDRFLESALESRDGAKKPVLRGWIYMQSEKKLVFNIGNNRYCENIGREHRSNHIKIVCDLVKFVYYQKCYDHECRSVNFKGKTYPLPEYVVFGFSSEGEFQQWIKRQAEEDF